MNYNKFVSSATLIPVRPHVTDMYNDMYINKDCKTIMRYPGGFIIQYLDDNEYLVRVNGEDFRAKTLHNAQSFLWMMEAEEKLIKIM